MWHMKFRLIAVLLALALTALFNSASFAQGGGGSDQVTARLRYDRVDVNNAQNYAMWLYPANPKPSSWTATSYGYLGAWVGSGSQFIQVGYNIDPGGVQWFAWSNGPIVCDRGYAPPAWNHWGCMGYYNDYASLDQFHMVQMDTDLNGTWQVFVYNAQGQGVKVAHKNFGTNVLYQMYTSSEESYNSPPDPYIMVRYYHFHPKYYKYPVGWTDWPCSDTKKGCQGGVTNHLQQEYVRLAGHTVL
jgi:hypothetical protein